jgi:8-oxo-dGTP pyrophosphatase MutT (NUDIX family)
MEAVPSIPRVAATMLLVRDDPFEVLMVRRHAKATFASALVFPGGVSEPDDAAEEWLPLTTGALDSAERAIRITAVRETWEETGLLIAARPNGEDPAGRMARSTPFRSLIHDAPALLPLDDIHPFAHWITPEREARRFDTRFFLARAPLGQQAVPDGGETIELEWVSPAAAVARTLAGDRSIIFPTLLNLMRLAENSDSDAAIRASRGRQPYTVQPRFESRDDGSTWITIPREAGYDRTEYRVTSATR